MATLDERPPHIMSGPAPFLLGDLDPEKRKPKTKPAPLGLSRPKQFASRKVEVPPASTTPAHSSSTPTLSNRTVDDEGPKTAATVSTLLLITHYPALMDLYTPAPLVFTHYEVPMDLCSPTDYKFLMDPSTPPTPKTPDWFHQALQGHANTFSRYTANCKFEHPGANRQNANPFSVLSNNNGRGGFGKPAGGITGTTFSGLTKEVIQKDLTEERPPWILSAYGPGRDAPEQLWGGYPIEQSFEEIRLHYMMGEMSGNSQGALSEIQGLYNAAQQKIQTALGNLDGAVNFVLQAQNNHPNRNDICQSSSSPSTGEFAVGRRPIGLQSQTSGTTAPSATNGGAFGQLSALGQKPNPFSTGGSSAFGQPSAPGQASAFGQASAPGQASAFGQASAPGQASAFGQPSAPGQTSAFGQPSALGGGSAFSQPSALGGGGAFGQASALGQKPSPFGQPSALGGGGAFGQTSALGQNSGSGFGQTSALGQRPSAFGAPAFGQAAQPAQSGGFGQTSQLGAKPSPFSSGSVTTSTSPFSGFAYNNNNNNSNNAPSASPFASLGEATSSASPFAQNGQQTTSSPFGQPASTVATNPFGQAQQATAKEVSMDTPGPAAASNPFESASAAPANPFGQPALSAANPFAQPSSNTNGFGAQAQQAPQVQQAQQATPAPSTGASNPYAPNASRQHPPLNSYATKLPTGQLQAWKGKAVVYKETEEKRVPGTGNFDGTFTKIWFPDGPPAYSKDTEPEREYTDDEKAVWQKFMATGKFELAGAGGGGMPEAPPLREFCTWDF